MSGERGAVADQVPGDRHGQGPCTCSGSVGAYVRRDQAGDDHREPDRARNLPALPQREEEAMGWGVLDRRLLREHGWPARQRADDWRLGQTAGLHLPQASPGPPAGAVPIANNSPLAAGMFYFLRVCLQDSLIPHLTDDSRAVGKDVLAIGGMPLSQPRYHL